MAARQLTLVELSHASAMLSRGVACMLYRERFLKERYGGTLPLT